MGWDEIATSEAVDLAERAVLAALSTWTSQDDERFGRELEVVLNTISQGAALSDSVLTCAVTIAALALSKFGTRNPVEAVRLSAVILRRLGGAGHGDAGVREPRSPYPRAPSTGAPPPDDLGYLA